MKKILLSIVSLVLIACAQHSTADTKSLKLPAIDEEFPIVHVFGAERPKLFQIDAERAQLIAAISVAEYDSLFNDGIKVKMATPDYAIEFITLNSEDMYTERILSLWDMGDGRGRILWRRTWYILPEAQFAIVNEILERH